MRHPFHRLQACKIPGNSGDWVLIAAAGSQINCFRLYDGVLLSTWSVEAGLNEFDHGNQYRSAGFNEAESPPGKRRKLSPPAETSTRGSSADAKAVPEGSVLAPLTASVINLTATWDQKHVVAVTGEDKCIRVFNLEDGGHLRLLSERCMPKRPSAIAVTPDNTTILCADKFGDVYALPLHPSPKTPAQASKEANIGTAGSTISQVTRKYVPAANNLTVHTARNQRALQNQLRLTNQVSERTAPTFEHKLLLGHVSMLTDILCVKLNTSLSPNGKPCTYIVTSDRDEHIRISRGPPQAYVIEGFCLGHRGFVTKLCVPYWLPKLLISGDGDGILIVWSWMKSEALQTVDIKPSVRQYLETAAKTNGHSRKEQTEPRILGGRAVPEDTIDKSKGGEIGEELEMNNNTECEIDDAATIDKFAICGIWAIPHETLLESERDVGLKKRVGNVLVAYEGISALFICELNHHSELNYRQAVPLRGNVLDVATLGPTSVIVSVDIIHRGNSTTLIEDPPREDGAVFQLLSQAESGVWSEDNADWPLNALNRQGSFKVRVEQGSEQAKSLRALLYRFQNLGKQGNED